MSLTAKQVVIALLGLLFLASLVLVQYTEVMRREEEAGLRQHKVAIPESSKRCYECHRQTNPGIAEHWIGSTHAQKGIGCIECHEAAKTDADAFVHEGYTIATVVTPRDCAKCHPKEADEFQNSHHAKAGNILHSLDNFLAETVEGSRVPFDPHSKTPGRPDLDGKVNGMASAFTGCQQCHGSLVGFEGRDGKPVTSKDLKPDAEGRPTDLEALARIVKNADGKPVFSAGSWPNTGIGRIKLDGSRGSCSACHSRHDFSPRRARQPENCGKCHLGPDHPQKEIYDESKHGIAYQDLKHKMNLDAKDWVLGQDYSAAPTCATCH
nr:multiheme c-type cytochrome [Planctomycetota bacterium]